MMMLNENVLTGLVRALQEKAPSPVVAATPNGSMLYNTVLPGVPFHDYDFVVFCEPFTSKKGVKQTFLGDYDLNFVDVTRFSEVVTRSTQFHEALYALHCGHAVVLNGDSMWFPYLMSLRQPVEKYFDLLSDVMTSHRLSMEESSDDSENFKKLKHLTRWGLYARRWGAGHELLDPRLSEGEREEFLKVLSSF